MGFVKIDLNKKPEEKNEPIQWAKIEEKKDLFPADLESWDNHFDMNEPTYSCMSNDHAGKILWCAMHISEFAGRISRYTMAPINSDTIVSNCVKDDMAAMLYFMQIMAQSINEGTLIDIMERTQNMVDTDNNRLE